MAEQDINSYRFGMGVEPTDEMLEQVMREAAEEARERFRVDSEAYFADMHKYAREAKAQWADQINRLKNG
jgi:hypothetical protein